MAKKAKKAKTEGVLERELREKAEAAAKAAAEQAAAEAAQAAEAVRLEAERKRAAKTAPRPKRARFVRTKVVAKPEVTAAPLPAPSTKLSAKLLSTVIKPIPKDDTISSRIRGPKLTGDAR